MLCSIEGSVYHSDTSDEKLSIDIKTKYEMLFIHRHETAVSLRERGQRKTVKILYGKQFFRDVEHAVLYETEQHQKLSEPRSRCPFKFILHVR